MRRPLHPLLQAIPLNQLEARELVSNAGRHPQVSANGNRIAMLWEENVNINDKRDTCGQSSDKHLGMPTRAGMVMRQDLVA